MSDCFYCDNSEKLHSLMIEICELPYSRVYLNRDQKHKGRCIVAFKEHKTEYYQLSEKENAVTGGRVDYKEMDRQNVLAVADILASQQKKAGACMGTRRRIRYRFICRADEL